MIPWIAVTQTDPTKKNVYAAGSELECAQLRSIQKKCSEDKRAVGDLSADKHGTNKIWPRVKQIE